MNYKLRQCIILTTVCDMLILSHVALYAGDMGRECSLHMQNMLTSGYMLLS